MIGMVMALVLLLGALLIACWVAYNRRGKKRVRGKRRRRAF